MHLGLIGYPLGHSRSPEIFKKIFEREKITGTYTLFPLENISEIRDFIAENPQLTGLNVTVPHKKTIIPFLDNASFEAADIGAVNVIRIDRSKDDGSIYLTGFNTDYYGFKNTLLDFLDGFAPVRALVLGTGGSSNAVAYALNTLGINPVKVSRDRKPGSIVYDEVTPELLGDFPLIINTTPLGMVPNTGTYPPIPYEALTSEHYLYDLVYNPEETLFLQKGKEKGAHTLNGLKMLHAQAEAAFSLFSPEEDDMFS